MNKTSGQPVLLNTKSTRPRNLSLLVSSKLVSSTELNLTFGQKMYLRGNIVGKFIDNLIALRDFLLYKLERREMLLSFLPFLRPKLEYIPDLEWRNLSKVTKNFYGFFQDENIVLETWYSLRERFLKSALYVPYPSSSNTVVLHVRLTDYLAHPEIGSLNEQYYLNCLNHFQGCKVLIVTDDVETFFSRFPNLSTVGEIFESTNDPLKSLKLMCNAKNLIIANSTFSYWAGIFAIMQDPDCKVLSPNQWRADGAKNSILCSKFQLEEATYL